MRNKRGIKIIPHVYTQFFWHFENSKDEILLLIMVKTRSIPVRTNIARTNKAKTNNFRTDNARKIIARKNKAKTKNVRTG